MSKTEQDVTERQVNVEGLVDKHFPGPDYRENQKEAIVTAVELFMEGDEWVLIDAPTGFGKSLVLYTIARVMADINDDKSYYTTPLKTLQDQITDDEFMGDRVIEMKGRSNYDCVHPEDRGTPVDRAICQKDSDFDCEYKDECPYYSRKSAATNHPVVVMNTSYLMAEGMVDPNMDNSFGHRTHMNLDEVQSLEDWALNFVGLTFTPRTLPNTIEDAVDIPHLEEDGWGDYALKLANELDEDVVNLNEIDVARYWLEKDVRDKIEAAISSLSTIPTKDDDELEELEKLKRFNDKIQRFLRDSYDNEWVATFDHKIVKNGDNYGRLELTPLFVGRFLDNLVWDRADYFVPASATLPAGDWVEEMGMDPSRTTRIKIPHSFPVENRKIITNFSVGKMTYNKRRENMPQAVETVRNMSEHHEGQKGIIHARAYNMVDLFRRVAQNNGHGEWYRENVHEQGRKSREEDLEEWKNNDKQIFLSVNMSEGIDLEGDLARWQVLLKTLYPNMQDKRVRRRVNDMGDWDWYNRQAATQIEQAYGRAVRSPEDEAVFYILDQSAIGLIKRDAELFHTWFLEAIDDMKIDETRGR